MNDMSKVSINEDKKATFEKARFDYCTMLYNEESKRHETIEKKSQFYLSFITLFLGAIFLKIDFLETLPEVIAQTQNRGHALVVFMYGTIAILAITLIIALISILFSVRVQVFTHPYPKELSEALFGHGSEYLEEETVVKLFNVSAMSYAIALEQNRQKNDHKAKWLTAAAYSVFIGVIAFTFFLAGLICFLR